MAKHRRGQMITPLEEDIKEEEETEGEAYNDEEAIDIDLFFGNEAPENSQSGQDDPLEELPVHQGSFKEKREFTLAMQKEIGLIVEQCVQVLNKDPREYHLFYVTVQKWLEIGFKFSHIPGKMFSVVWEKCDSFACSEFDKYKKKHTVQRKLADLQSPFLKDPTPQKKNCSLTTSKVETAWEKILSSTTFSQKPLSSLKTRLFFFQRAKTLTSPQECCEMNFLWERLLSSKLQQAPALTSPDVPGREDKLSKAYPMTKRLKIIIKMCASERKSEIDEKQKKKSQVTVKRVTGQDQKKILSVETKHVKAERERLRKRNKTDKQRQIRAERARIRRRNMTDEQRKIKAEKERLRRKNKTDEQKQIDAERERLCRKNKTAEQRQIKAERQRLRRKNKTDEQRQIDAERERLRRKNQTDEQRQAQAKRLRLRRQKQTVEQKQAEAKRSRLRRQNQTIEQKQAKIKRDRLHRLNCTRERKEAEVRNMMERRVAEMNLAAGKNIRNLEREKITAEFERNIHREKESFRLERSKKEDGNLQYLSEDELFLEAKVETQKDGLTVQESFVFENQSEFEAETEKAMMTIIKESVAVLGIDPREYHPFYLKLHLFIEAGLEQNFIDSTEVNSIWEIWDSAGVSQFLNKLDNSSTKLSVEEFEKIHGPSLHLDFILFNRIPFSTPIRSWSEADREAQYQAVTKGWRDILVNEASSIDLRSNLSLRLKLFQSCSSMTFLEDSSRMTKYWGKLFNGELDTFEEKIKMRLSQLQKMAKEAEEDKRQKKWARYLRHQAFLASLTEEEKRERSQKRMMLHASKTQEEKKEMVRINKINRHKFTGERKKRHQESLRRSLEKIKQKMEQLKMTNFEKWKKITEEQRKRQLELYNKMTKTETPEQRQKRLAKYKIYAKKALLKKQIANGVITEEEMDIQFQEAKKRIEEETFSAPPKPYKERPRKKKLVETVTSLTPTCLEKVEQPVFNTNLPTVIMFPESSTRTVILVDGKVLNENYAPASPCLIQQKEIFAPGTEELVKSPLYLEVKVREETASALETELPPRSSVIECFDDYAAPFHGVCDEFEDNHSPEVGNEVTTEVEMDGEKRQVVAASLSLMEPGFISTTDDNDNPVPKSFPNPPIMEVVDEANGERDLLLNSHPTLQPENQKVSEPKVSEQKSVPEKKRRVNKERIRLKIPCPKCDERFCSENLCYHYEKCGTLPKTKTSSAPATRSTEVLSCPQCSQWFTSVHALARHQYFAHGDGTNPENHLRCHLCFKSFRQKATLDDHIRRVHEGKGFYCDLCPNRGDLQSAGKLWKHKVSFHGLEDLPPPSKVTVVQCEFCGETVLGRYSLHVKKKHPEMLTQLKTLFQPKFKKGLTRDPNNPAGKLRQCPECLKMINTHWLSKHRKMVHGIGESYFCPECNLELKYKSHLNKHVEKKHGIQEKFRQYNLVGDDPSNKHNTKCFLCLETFNATANAQIHVIENHKEVYEYLKTGSKEKAEEVEEKTFKCIKCLQDFEGGNTLAEHYKEEHNLENGTTKRKRSNRSIKKRRDEENGCRCEDCGVKFETREDWIKHRHTEHNVKIEKLEEVLLKPKKVKLGKSSRKVTPAKAVIKKKTQAATKKKKQSIERKLVEDVATVRRSLRKIIKRKFINEDCDSEDSENAEDSKVPRVCVNVEADSLVKQMKILKVSLLRLTKEEIEQYRFNR